MSRRLHERAIARAEAARAGRASRSIRVSGPSEGQEKSSALDRTAGAAWVGYLVALFYIAVTVLGVTHQGLLLEAPVKLPLLGTAIPLRAFFVLAPIAFLLFHASVLVHAARVAARGGSPGEPSEGALAAVSRGLAFCALAVAPVLLLLLVLIQYLPFHDEPVTWLHRFAILADVASIWLLWPALAERRERLQRPDPRRHAGLLIAGLVPIGLAFTAATFPGEWLDDLVGRRQWFPSGRAASLEGQGETGWTSVHDLLFHGAVDEVRLRRDSPFSNTLVLAGFDAPAAVGLDDPKALESARTTLTLRGRRLEGAVLIGADLCKADLSGAALDGARLDRADLQGATLEDARLRRAILVEASLGGALMKLARLQEARLDGVQARGVSLVSAQLQGASLKEAQLQDAALGSAQLQGASLVGARLEGATLADVQLQGAKLDSAELQDAVLDHAQMQGASLEGARLQGASLLGAQLQGVSLDRAELQGTVLLGANLAGASLVRAALQGAVLRDAVLQGASLDLAQAQGAVLDYAQLEAASLRGAQLQGASLREAVLIGTSLAQANVWRARLERATVQAIYDEGIEDTPPVQRAVLPSSLEARPDAAEQGSSRAAYAALKALIVHEMPKAQKRKDVMSRIEVLDPDTAVAETGAAAALALGRVNEATYRKVMADWLVHLACAGGDFDRDIVLGLARSHRIDDAGPFAPGVVDSILVPACPVFATLGDADKEALGKAAKSVAATVSDPAQSAEQQGPAWKQ
jgi:uncharacterized protein YjbI with pentapeptide repeats